MALEFIEDPECRLEVVNVRGRGDGLKTLAGGVAERCSCNAAITSSARISSVSSRPRSWLTGAAVQAELRGDHLERGPVGFVVHKHRRAAFEVGHAPALVAECQQRW